jgi:hypothetical protein
MGYLLKYKKNPSKMKTLITILSVLISVVGFSQNSIQNNEAIKTVDLIDETLKVNASHINTAPTNYDENTNNPETTGSVKKIVNGKEIYIKDYVINGLNVVILNEPNK